MINMHRVSLINVKNFSRIEDKSHFQFKSIRGLLFDDNSVNGILLVRYTVFIYQNILKIITLGLNSIYGPQNQSKQKHVHVKAHCDFQTAEIY